jgi:hypothetical protein
VDTDEDDYRWNYRYGGRYGGRYDDYEDYGTSRHRNFERVAEAVVPRLERLAALPDTDALKVR